jgi:NAD(P)-dependent dehydrogenase (short-subunit alcohol dehydrogenase family)
VNAHGPIDLAQAALPAMLAAGEGWIVNVSSGSARLTDGPPFRAGAMSATIGVYGASKAALNRLTNALAVELYGTGVRINTVEPRAAVHSVGADVHLGDSLPADMYESMEEMVEGTVALCDCDADHTGRVDVSLDLIDERGLTVMGLDGRPHP